MLDNSIVFDVGGTYTRYGIYLGYEDELIEVCKIPSPNFLSFSSKEQLIGSFVFLTKKIVNDLTSKFPNLDIKDIGISFPGPVSEDGTVLCAPTLWGTLIKKLNIKYTLCSSIKNYNIDIINDITAAGWRYIERFDGNFCVITISSGVGCKVFRDYKVLLNKEGLGGELGHHYLNNDEYKDIPCDCGQKGHIGSVSSGRGIEKLAYYLSEKHGGLFKESCLSSKDKITTHDIVEAIKQKDEFSLYLLEESIKPIVNSISCLYAFIGTKKFLFIGGFALAVGIQYINCVKDIIKDRNLMGLDSSDIDNMIILGEADDNSGLIGMGRYLRKKSCRKENTLKFNEYIQR